MKTYQAGIDVGSTTVKLVVLDENGQMIFGQYQRHLSHTQRALSDLLKQARAALGECALELRATGSGAINLAKALGIPFVQEVVAVAQALERRAAGGCRHRTRRRGCQDHLLQRWARRAHERRLRRRHRLVYRPDGRPAADRCLGSRPRGRALSADLPHRRALRRVRQDGYPAPHQRGCDEG